MFAFKFLHRKFGVVLFLHIHVLNPALPNLRIPSFYPNMSLLPSLIKMLHVLGRYSWNMKGRLQ